MQHSLSARPRLIVFAVALALLALLAPAAAAQVPPSPRPTPAPSPTPRVAPSPVPSPTRTPAIAPSPVPQQTPSPARTPAPGQSPAPSPAPSPTPGPPPKIVEIVLRGIERVPQSVVLDSIGTRVGELLSEERLRADVAAVLATGWFADANIRVEPVRDGVRVAFLVVENPNIDELVIEGNTKIPTAEITRALNMPTGQVLNIARLRDGARAVEKLYQDRGYVIARITDVGVIANGVTRLRLRIVEGRIEAFEYKGLAKTQRFVVERDRKIKVGDVFNINDLNQYLQSLVNLDLFESVQARPRPGATLEAVIIEIEVKEQRTQQARFGVGYNDRTGITGLLEYSEKNWKGRNQSVSIRYERGFGERGIPVTGDVQADNFVLSFRDPRVDSRQTGMDVVLYKTSSTEAEYEKSTINSRFTLERLGSTIAFTRPVAPQTALTLRLRSEDAKITLLPVDPTDPVCVANPSDPACVKRPPSFFSPGRAVVLSLSGVRDTRDNRVNPTKGERLSLTIDLGLKLLGSDFGFGKYVAEYTRYLPGGSGVFAGRALAGFSSGTVPFQEWFVIGGPSTLRAYPGQFQRGTNMSLVSVEYRLPLGLVARQLRDFTGIVFADAGSAWTRGADFKFGYGVGVSFSTGLGAIRVDYAIGSEGSQTWLTIGSPF